MSFSEQTFRYFDLAHRNRMNKEWFLKNKNRYEDHVKEPFAELVREIKKELRRDLPLISIDEKSITRPLRPKNRAAEKGFVKDFTSVSFAQKRASLFEWNPGLHLQFGRNADDNFYGLGLYMISSRQLKLLRHHLSEDFEEIHEILQEPKFKKAWGGILGEKYKRFPKGYDSEDERNQYLWHKQFYLGRELTRKQASSKRLKSKIVSDFKVAMPFLKWVRKSVGTLKASQIKKNSSSPERF